MTENDKQEIKKNAGIWAKKSVRLSLIAGLWMVAVVTGMMAIAKVLMVVLVVAVFYTVVAEPLMRLFRHCRK